VSTNERVRLTEQGLKELREELERLRTVERAKISARIREAKEGGDISESGEYEDAKHSQAFLEGRIKELEKLLANAEVIDRSAQPAGTVGLGSKVTVEENGRTYTYTIVDGAEAGRGRDGEVRISSKSAVGSALLGRRVGDSVEVEVPAGKLTFKILSVE